VEFFRAGPASDFRRRMRPVCTAFSGLLRPLFCPWQGRVRLAADVVFPKHSAPGVVRSMFQHHNAAGEAVGCESPELTFSKLNGHNS